VSSTGSANDLPVNIIRLNQQDVSQIQPLHPDPVNGQISKNTNTSTTKSIFSLSQTTLSEQQDTPQQLNMNTINHTSTQLSTNKINNGETEGKFNVDPATKTTSISFTPKKFVPAEKSSNLKLEPMFQTNQLPTNDKIKAKWSPGPTMHEEQPTYKKIQPIFQKPKSPHKIT